MATWPVRSTAGGVLRAFDFSTSDQFGVSWNTDSTIDHGWGTNSTLDRFPVRDTTVGPSLGSCSIRFDFPSLSTGNPGSWLCDFWPSRTNTLVAGSAHDHIYIQYRTKSNTAGWTTDIIKDTGGNQAGIKLSDIGTCLPLHLATTSSNTKVVQQTYYQTRVLQSYCYDVNVNDSGLWETLGGGDVAFQNAKGAPYCRYSNVPGVNNCFLMVPDEWITIKIYYKVLPRIAATPWLQDFEYKLWAQRDGGASVLLIDWNSTKSGYFPQFCGAVTDNETVGRLNLFPYMTAKDPTQVHSLLQYWFSEVIISESDIADATTATTSGAGVFVGRGGIRAIGRRSLTRPIAHAGSGGSSGGSGTPGIYPAWRTGSVNTWSSIANTSSMQGSSATDGFNEVDGAIDLWNSCGIFSDNLVFILGSGHGEYPNGAHKLNLALDAPSWITLKGTSAPAPVLPWTSISDPTPANGSPIVYDSAYYRDGTPVGRHTYDTIFAVPSARDYAGKDRVYAFGTYAAAGLNMNPVGHSAYNTGTNVDSYNITTGAYEVSGTHPVVPGWDYLYTFCQDPTLRDVYFIGPSAGSVTQVISRFDPLLNTWLDIQPTPQYPSAFRLRAWQIGAGYPTPRCFDTSRNRIVGLIGGSPNQPTTATLQCLTITGSHASPVITVTNIGINSGPLSGVIVQPGGMVYDPDNDRYLYAQPTTTTTPIYAIDPVSGASSLLNTVPEGVAKGGAFDRFCYMSTYKAVVYVPRFYANVYYMPTAA